MIFVSRFQFESVDTFGDSTQVPIFDRQFLGGSYTLRGYEYREVSQEKQKVMVRIITKKIQLVEIHMLLHQQRLQCHYGIM